MGSFRGGPQAGSARSGGGLGCSDHVAFPAWARPQGSASLLPHACYACCTGRAGDEEAAAALQSGLPGDRVAVVCDSRRAWSLRPGAVLQGQYSKHPRRTSMKDEVEQAEGGTSFTKEVAKRQAAEAAAAAADAAARGGAEQQQQRPPPPAEQKAQPQAAGQPKEEQQKPPAAEVAAGDANQQQQQQQGPKQPAPPAGQPALQAPAGEEGYEDQPYR